MSGGGPGGVRRPIDQGVAREAGSVASSAAPSAETQAGQGAVTIDSPRLRGNATLDAVAAGGGRGLERGSRDREAVRAIQTALKDLQYPIGVDGGYGSDTATQVAAFQRAQGLTPSGQVDTPTLQALDHALAGRGLGAARAGADRDIVYVGMGKDTKHEAAHLRSRGAGVDFIGDSALGNDKTSMDVKDASGRTTRKTYDLTQAGDVDRYVADLGLTGTRAAQVKKAISEVGDDAKDEVADLARTMNEAENGGRVMERIAFSGHHVGSGVWGDDNGRMPWDTVGELAKAFPRAANQVEDLMIAGCYSGGESAMEEYKGIFPNLKTIWAYQGSAPGTWSGANAHIQRWEQATRGHDPSQLKRSLAENTRKGENVAVWTKTGGYDDGSPAQPLDSIRQEATRYRPAFEQSLGGQRAITDPQTDDVRQYYNRVQRMLSRTDLPADERRTLEATRDQTIRLLFYENVSRRFNQTYQSQIQTGYAALGRPAPNFSTMSRADALREIQSFGTALGERFPRPPAADRLYQLLSDGLKDLKPSAIPEGWV